MIRILKTMVKTFLIFLLWNILELIFYGYSDYSISYLIAIFIFIPFIYKSTRNKTTFDRILEFDIYDWKLVHYLFTNMIKSFIRKDYDCSIEAYYFLRLHLMYNSVRIEEKDKEED